MSKFSPKIIGDTKLFYYSKYGLLVIGQNGMELFHLTELLGLGSKIPLFLYPCTSVMARAQRQL